MRVRSTAALCVVLAYGCVLLQPSVAQDQPEPDQVVSREQWRANVEEARRRIDQMRREGRSFAPPPESAADASSEMLRRVLEDDSLRPGDIVSTDRGLLVFRGRSSSEPGLKDFAPIDLSAKKP